MLFIFEKLFRLSCFKCWLGKKMPQLLLYIWLWHSDHHVLASGIAFSAMHDSVCHCNAFYNSKKRGYAVLFLPICLKSLSNSFGEKNEKNLLINYF